MRQSFIEDGPIIRSLLDTDFYKFTMGGLVHEQFADVPVRYEFKNRTADVPLGQYIKEADLRRELDHVRTLRLTRTERHYLNGTDEYDPSLGTDKRMFSRGYLDFLQGLRLPEYRLIYESNGTISLSFPGKWSEAIYWEVPALAIINELYYRAKLAAMGVSEREAVFAQGTLKLAKKIELLKQRPDIIFTDFGTRRRFSRAWQEYVNRTLKAEFTEDRFRGTSNVLLARDLELLPMGTSAHEMFMALYGIMHGSDEELVASHNRTLQLWWEKYGEPLSIALTDTYGTDFFFRDFTPEQARLWRGLRQDSGDPFKFGERAIAFYRDLDINPMTKLLVFSDGLDDSTIIELADRFRGRIKVTFGWGTNLTNDLGFKALSLVIKLVEADGHGTIKLSDNLAKAMGKPEHIERGKRLFVYTGNTFEQPRY